MPASTPIPTPLPPCDAQGCPDPARSPAMRRPALSRRASGRTLLALAAGGALSLLAGCETVSLNTPAPVVVLHPASAPSAPASAAAPAPPQAPAAQAQGLQPTPGVQVQPLAPASAASLPALPASGAAPAAPTPPASAALPASAPAAPAMPGSAPAASAPAAAASAAAAGAVRYVCNDGTSFLATFGDINVTMSTALGVLTLDQTVAADGARYANAQIQVWFKGRQATITRLRNPDAQVLCLEQR